MFTQSIECPNCQNNITEDWSYYITSSDVVDENRGMGAETEHSIECDEYECTECHKKFYIKGSIWEYPEGAYNYHEFELEEIQTIE